MAGAKFKYMSLYEALKKGFYDGTYRIGSLFPTEDELSSQYNVSKTTIRKATKLLAQEGFIDVRQGSGTYVKSLVQTETGVKYGSLHGMSLHFNTDGDGITSNVDSNISLEEADEAAAAALGIPAGSKVYCLQRLHIVDGRIYGFVKAHYRADYFPDLDKKSANNTGKIFQLLNKEYGSHLVRVEDTFDAASSDSMVSRMLAIREGTPLLLIHRTAFSDKGPFEYSCTYMRPDIYQMTITIDHDYFNV